MDKLDPFDDDDDGSDQEAPPPAVPPTLITTSIPEPNQPQVQEKVSGWNHAVLSESYTLTECSVDPLFSW